MPVLFARRARLRVCLLRNI